MTEMIRSGLVAYHPALMPLLTAIDLVHPHPDNYNNGDLDELCTSIETNGMYRPVYAQRSTGHLVAGNSTWEACKTLDADQIPVVYLDIDDIHARRIMLADNRVAQLAVADPALLLPLLQHLDDADSLLGTGYHQGDLAALAKLNETPIKAEQFDTWPTLCIQVHPAMRTAYYQLTAAAGGDTDRFAMLLRMAGWDGE